MKASSPAKSSRTDPAAALRKWFSGHARRLPWRDGYDPYHVWVSEVMLQQTQVETVLPYYARFLERFPTLERLARSSEDDVLKLWSGLGYYHRARNLRRAAGQVVERHGGRVPSTHEELIGLPGVGRYMAGAIRSIAFDQPAPIVDGNVRRVLARFHGWEDPPDRDLWSAAARMVETGSPRLVNQGMMELGATVCTPRSPGCGQCPWKGACAAFRERTADRIPLPKKRRATVRVDLHAVVDRTGKGVLMREKDGLWEFPLLAEPPADRFDRVGHCRHAITHHRVEVDVYIGKLERRPGLRRVRFDSVAVTSLTKKIHDVIRRRESGSG